MQREGPEDASGNTLWGNFLCFLPQHNRAIIRCKRQCVVLTACYFTDEWQLELGSCLFFSVGWVFGWVGEGERLVITAFMGSAVCFLQKYTSFDLCVTVPLVMQLFDLITNYEDCFYCIYVFGT